MIFQNQFIINIFLEISFILPHFDNCSEIIIFLKNLILNFSNFYIYFIKNLSSFFLYIVP